MTAIVIKSAYFDSLAEAKVSSFKGNHQQYLPQLTAHSKCICVSLCLYMGYGMSKVKDAVGQFEKPQKLVESAERK